MIYINDTSNTLWIASDNNPIGCETSFNKTVKREEAILIAVAEFLGFDPESVLSL